MRIAIVTAMAEETLPLYNKLGNVVDENVISGVLVRKIVSGADTIYLATAGIGEIYSALAVQMFKDVFDVEAVLNFGFVGALDSSLEIGEMVIAQKVLHYQMQLGYVNNTPPGQYNDRSCVFFDLNGSIIDRVRGTIGKPIRLVNVASGDKFIADKTDKSELRALGCDICEMELAGLAVACERNNLPLFSLKVVSDKADCSAAESFESVVNRGLSKYEEVLPQVLAALVGEGNALPPARTR